MSTPIPDGYELKKKRSWFARHKILSVIGAIFLIVALSNAFGGGGSTTTGDTADTASAPEAAAPDAAPAAPAPAAAKPKAAAPKPPAPAIVTTSKELIAVLEGNALKAKNTYEDKRVTVSGVVGSIDASGDYFALDPAKDAFVLTGVQVRTSEKFQDQVANFEKGQAVTVTGKITDVGEIIGYQLKAETIK